MKKIILLSIFYLLLTNVHAHPFYVSVTDIDFKNNSIQVSIKVFVEDLEAALELQGKPKLNLGEPNENDLSKEYIKQYLLPRFYLKVNNELKSYKYVGQEVESDAIWIYLEINNIEKVNSLEVKNSIITEKHEGQTNLVHSNINGLKKSLILNKLAPSGKLTF